AAPAPRPRRGAPWRSGAPRAEPRREECLPGSTAEQPRGAESLYALRFPQGCRAPRLLSGALRARGGARPDVGAVTRRLNMLAAIGLSRGENVYIANVLKCRPPGNRNPESEEVAKCTPFLKRQIALIQPKLIIAMGRFAAQTLLASDASIASLRGRVFSYEGVPLIVTYHPAYLLRSLADKSKASADRVLARKTMASL